MFFVLGFQDVRIGEILRDSFHIEKTGEKIAFISGQFLNTPYMANTLAGGPDVPEELVVNLDGMDCFTFLDYVEALRLSKNSEEFNANLKRVRYFGSEVSFAKRKHFFTDWISGDNPTVKDITPDLPGAITVEKYINRKSDTNNWLKNVPNTMRMVTYIPSDKIDKDLIKMLQNGDYIGIYSDREGLDVSHTGIFIRNEKGEFFRNTSSIVNKVTDYLFKDYKDRIKGIIVFRAKSQ